MVTTHESDYFLDFLVYDVLQEDNKRHTFFFFAKTIYNLNQSESGECVLSTNQKVFFFCDIV